MTPTLPEDGWVPITVKNRHRPEPASNLGSGTKFPGTFVKLKLDLREVPPNQWKERFEQQIAYQTSTAVLGQVLPPPLSSDTFSWTIPSSQAEQTFGVIKAALASANSAFSQARPRIREAEGRRQQQADPQRAELDELQRKLDAFEF